MRAITSSYNEAVGGVNDDRGGYHDTLTDSFIAGACSWLWRCPATGLVHLVNGLRLSPEGQRGWPLRFYSRERLFSVAARRGRVVPDIKSLP